MDRVLSRRLRALDDPARLELAREIVERLGSRFDSDVCSLLVEELDRVSRPLLESLARHAAGHPKRSLAADTIAIRQRRIGVPPGSGFFPSRHGRDPFDLLAWSRALAATGALEEAAQKLRMALAQDVRYTFFARAEKLVHELAGSVQSNLRQCKIAVLGSSTRRIFWCPYCRRYAFATGLELRSTRDHMARSNRKYGMPTAGWPAFQPGIVMLVMHWRDLNLEAVTEDEQAWIGQFIEERKADWKRLSDSFACHIIQPSFDYPACEAYGHLADVLDGGRTRVIDLLNLRLREEAPANVSILNMAAAQREVGTKRWEDELAWTRYRQHPTTDALPELAEAYMSHVRSVLGLSRKVLVTDLDNTLWGGVIGEDASGRNPHRTGQRRRRSVPGIAGYMQELKHRGILLAVCSKNNLEDAQLPFLRHPTGSAAGRFRCFRGELGR